MSEGKLDDETERAIIVVEINACSAQFTRGDDPKYLALLDARSALRDRVRELQNEARKETLTPEDATRIYRFLNPFPGKMGFLEKHEPDIASKLKSIANGRISP